MAPAHWSDLSEENSGGSPSANHARGPGSHHSSPQDRLAPRPDPHREAIRRAQGENPAFAKLIEERAALEQRMQTALSGGQTPIDPRDAVRFAVPGMAQRRAEHEAWQARRDRSRRKARPRPPPAPEPALRRFGRALGPAGGVFATGIAPLALRPTRAEQPGGSPSDPERWMQARDAARLHRPAPAGDDYDRLDQRLDRARSVAGQVQDPMADLDRQFDEADQKLAAEGLETERQDLQRMRDETNLNAFNRQDRSGNDPFDKFRSTTDRTKDAGARLEQDWLARRDAIGGEDFESYMKPLRALKDRVLGMNPEDFDRRSDARRTAALERRRERLREEQAEEKRRERALERRRERDNAD